MSNLKQLGDNMLLAIIDLSRDILIFESGQAGYHKRNIALIITRYDSKLEKYRNMFNLTHNSSLLLKVLNQSLDNLITITRNCDLNNDESLVDSSFEIYKIVEKIRRALKIIKLPPLKIKMTQ
jgi:hypothetical protein